MSFRLTSLLAAALILGGCSSLMMSGGGSSYGTPDGTERSATEQARDANISAAVRSRYASDPAISAYSLGVQTVNGKVTLTGTVDSYGDRNQAYRLARQVEGVEAVINRLNVTESSN